MSEASDLRYNLPETIEQLNPVEVYSGGLDAVLEKIAKFARKHVPDASTEAGRKEIASNAYKVTRSKTLLDEMGKTLGEEWRKKLEKINADRKYAVTFCENLKDEVSKPLTEWKEKEATRLADHAQALTVLSVNFNPNADVEVLQAHLDMVEKTYGRDWQEFREKAEVAYIVSKKALSDAIASRIKYDEEQKELAALRAEKAKRDEEEKAKQDEANRIAEEAAIKARFEEEAKKKAQAEIAAANAAKEKAEADAKAAAERAEREKQAAVEAERKRAEDAKKAEEQAAKDREKDKGRRAEIHNAILKVLVENSVPRELAKAIIKAIALNKVPHVRILY